MIALIFPLNTFFYLYASMLKKWKFSKVFIPSAIFALKNDKVK